MTTNPSNEELAAIELPEEIRVPLHRLQADAHRRHRDLLILAVIGLAISGAAKWMGWW